MPCFWICFSRFYVLQLCHRLLRDPYFRPEGSVLTLWQSGGLGLGREEFWFPTDSWRWGCSWEAFSLEQGALGGLLCRLSFHGSFEPPGQPEDGLMFAEDRLLRIRNDLRYFFKTALKTEVTRTCAFGFPRPFGHAHNGLPTGRTFSQLLLRKSWKWNPSSIRTFAAASARGAVPFLHRQSKPYCGSKAHWLPIHCWESS